MKYASLLILFLFPLLLSAQQKTINWVSIEEAQELMKKEPKKIMMDVYTKWCGPCKMMMKNTFSNPDVIAYVNENYYAVKFDAESPDAISFKGVEYTNPNYDPNRRGRNGVHQFTRVMKVSAYPTVIYMDENLNLLHADRGYKTPTQIELMLKFFAQEDYRQVTTQEQWTSYQNNFKSTFKE